MKPDIKQDKKRSYIIITTVIFVLLITALAWQSDDAYHAYVMARHLVEGNGFVYNIGERASASSCPLFTLVIACGYFLFRNMFVVSLLICIVFSTIAYIVLVRDFCRGRIQITSAFLTLVMSAGFISYTTSGLENSMLFLLAALFLKQYLGSESYNTKQLFFMAILVALIAMTRMDAVLMFVPMAVYAYLFKRDNVSFIKAVFTGLAGLLPFMAWEVFSIIYYGFPFPNTAYVKLGTAIPLKEYIIRGVLYSLVSLSFDPVLLFIPAVAVLAAFAIKNMRYTMSIAGIIIYMAYIIYIGGDFMVGRHYTVLFLMSVIAIIWAVNYEGIGYRLRKKLFKAYLITAAAGIVLSFSLKPITNQYLYGYGNSPISDERGGYFKYTSLYNNALSVLRTGDMVIRDAWNEQGIDELREAGYTSGMLVMVPGISIYYNSDIYLNDLYALGDPFLSKLPAVREDNWRIGHMWREAPVGYAETVLYGEDVIENDSIREYYEIIKLITRGSIWDKDRLNAVIGINTGRYDHLIEEYRSTLDEDNHQVTDKYFLSR
ncbi:MAG: glycosyltransferase family 39 protein [Lachnospiraceae bacterium]|nr:glycosyltransferase family 39 protein [Lachnospiraceae bacterium]MBR6487141.1 glycosyltransferase family 39 protein [Lachnospiraceae bacterium]